MKNRLKQHEIDKLTLAIYRRIGKVMLAPDFLQGIIHNAIEEYLESLNNKVN